MTRCRHSSLIIPHSSFLFLRLRVLRLLRLLHADVELAALVINPLLETLLPRAEVVVQLLHALLALARLERLVIGDVARARDERLQVVAQRVGLSAQARRLVELLDGGRERRGVALAEPVERVLPRVYRLDEGRDGRAACDAAHALR